MLLLLLRQQLRSGDTSRRDRATANRQFLHPSWVLWCARLQLLLVVLLGGGLLLLACQVVCCCGLLMLQVDAVKPIHLQP
jgi:hypothetical protein